MIKQTALKYLGYQDNLVDKLTEQLLNECLVELEMITPKFMYQKYSLAHQPLMIKELDLEINYPELIDLFKESKEIVIIAGTLGIDLEQKLRYLAKIDLTKMTVMDAMASSYLESKLNEFVVSCNLGATTWCYCPGYGRVPLQLNQTLASILDCSKHIGLTVNNSGLLIPQKSIIGMIGIGTNTTTKQCLNCVNKNNCIYQKRGQTCYKID